MNQRAKELKLDEPVNVLSKVVDYVTAKRAQTDNTEEQKIAQLIYEDTGYDLERIKNTGYWNLGDYLVEYIRDRDNLCNSLNIDITSNVDVIVRKATDNGTKTIKEAIDEIKEKIKESNIGGGYKRKTTKRRSSKRRSSKRRSSKRRSSKSKKYSIKRNRRSNRKNKRYTKRKRR